MKRFRTNAVLLFIVLGLTQGAVSFSEAASLSVDRPAQRSDELRHRLPHSVTFHEVKEHGLLVKIWVNQNGPYTFAIDTGAGITLIGRRAPAEAGTDRSGETVFLGGLSGAGNSQGRTTVIRGLAIGDAEDFLPINQKAIVVDNLPDHVD